MIIYQNIDPIIFQLGPFAIRWYGLFYVLGLLGSFWYFQKEILRQNLFKKQEIESFATFLCLAVILGARIGYCLIYNLKYYIQRPLEIAAFWQGGLSFHGGLLGALLCGVLFIKKKNKSFLRLADVAVRAVPIGLFFGRIGNFLNSELYGRSTGGNWGVVFQAGGNIPRHPSQLYEAFLEGIVLFIILWLINKRHHSAKGILTSGFILFYGLFRFFVEFFRAPDTQLGFIWGSFTMGQCLSIPMIITGVVLYIYFTERGK